MWAYFYYLNKLILTLNNNIHEITRLVSYRYTSHTHTLQDACDKYKITEEPTSVCALPRMMSCLPQKHNLAEFGELHHMHF